MSQLPGSGQRDASGVRSQTPNQENKARNEGRRMLALGATNGPDPTRFGPVYEEAPTAGHQTALERIYCSRLTAELALSAAGRTRVARGNGFHSNDCYKTMVPSEIPRVPHVPKLDLDSGDSGGQSAGRQDQQPLPVHASKEPAAPTCSESRLQEKSASRWTFIRISS